MAAVLNRAKMFLSAPLVALEARLRHCEQIVTLGVRPNFSDYTTEQQALIRQADKIYYPSSFYADLLDTLGKKTFPSYQTYKFAQDKIKQTALFQMGGIPHPRTYIFYGSRQKKDILSTFNLPLIAKVPRGSALGRGVFLIETQAALDHYCQMDSPAYIQEYLPIDRDIRVIVIGGRAVNAYWRIASPGEYRANVALGGTISFSDIPPKALALAEDTAKWCGWDDVGIDICFCRGGYYVLEANMKYGKEGFRLAGINYDKLMEQLIIDGQI